MKHKKQPAQSTFHWIHPIPSNRTADYQVMVSWSSNTITLFHQRNCFAICKLKNICSQYFLWCMCLLQNQSHSICQQLNHWLENIYQLASEGSLSKGFLLPGFRPHSSTLTKWSICSFSIVLNLVKADPPLSRIHTSMNSKQPLICTQRIKHK